MCKNKIYWIFAVIFAFFAAYKAMIFVSKGEVKTTPPIQSPTVVNAREILNEANIKICNGDLAYIEVLHIPKNAELPINCDINCIEKRYLDKLKISYDSNNSYRKPLVCEIFRNINITKMETDNDFRYASNFYNKKGEKFLFIYGSPSGNVLINKEVGVHLDEKYSNFIFGLFGE